MQSTLVLGVGNTLLADDGAGVHAMRHLAATCSLPNTTLLDAGTLSFTLAGSIAEADNLIVFDAAQLSLAPGTVRVFEGGAFDAFLRSGRRSVHEVGLADLVDIARLEGSMPGNYALIGIQPATLGWGSRPSGRVRRALPEAAAAAIALYQKWTGVVPVAAAS